MRGREYEAPATLSNRRKPRDMQTNLELRRVTQSLKVAEERLQTASVNYPSLNPAIRAVRKLALRVNRPARVAILGETNAGKSCLANALIGDETMPTLATANTRLPTLLRYARTPTIEVVHRVRQTDRRGDHGMRRCRGKLPALPRQGRTYPLELS